ncbi:hypothetical protein D6D18_06411 [Aureobasidium pullulans]|nr:hypothetical protein D6D18_06411 [Aureobasidium pullulans]
MAARNPNLCDHANEFNQTKASCSEDMGGGWNTCDDEPTNRPVGGRPDHDNKTICLECWQNVLADMPVGLHYDTTIKATFGNLAYRRTAWLGNQEWILQDNAIVREVDNCINSTQTLLCKYCVLDEIAQWRRCESNQNYANAMMAMTGRSQFAEDGHTNTCVCRKKYMTHPYYFLECLRDALDDRVLTATRNKDWLDTIAHTASGERRIVSDEWQTQRFDQNMTIPCRCGRDIDRHDRHILASTPRATFCLACNGTKMWPANILPPPHEIRSSRARLPISTLRYPLQTETGNVLNTLELGLHPDAGTVRRPS